VLPNVRAILERLQEIPDVCSLLLTGNTRAGARAKLSHYGLQTFFADGAFSDDTTDRPSIARNAMVLARNRVGEVAPDRIYVIGDTPHDIQCGRAIEARVIAVATGGYSLEELGGLQPWWLLPELPSPDQFLERLGLGVPRCEICGRGSNICWVSTRSWIVWPNSTCSASEPTPQDIRTGPACCPGMGRLGVRHCRTVAAGPEC
jgi:hypothetical protein